MVNLLISYGASCLFVPSPRSVNVEIARSGSPIASLTPRIDDLNLTRQNSCRMVMERIEIAREPGIPIKVNDQQGRLWTWLTQFD